MTAGELLSSLIDVKNDQLTIIKKLSLGVDASGFQFVVDKIKILEERITIDKNPVVTFSTSELLYDIIIDVMLSSNPLTGAIGYMSNKLISVAINYTSSDAYFEKSFSKVLQTSSVEDIVLADIDTTISILSGKKALGTKERLNTLIQISSDYKDTLKICMDKRNGVRKNGVAVTTDTDFVVNIYEKIKDGFITRESIINKFFEKLIALISRIKETSKIPDDTAGKLDEYFKAFKENKLSDLDSVREEMKLQIEFHFWTAYLLGGQKLGEWVSQTYQSTLFRETFFPASDIMKQTIDYLIKRFPAPGDSYLDRIIVKRKPEMKTGKNAQEYFGKDISKMDPLAVQQMFYDKITKDKSLGAPKDNGDNTMSFYDEAVTNLGRALRYNFNKLQSGIQDLNTILDTMKI